MSSRNPTRTWRVQGMLGDADTKALGDFDEIVVGKWLHVEMLDRNCAYVCIGKQSWNVLINKDGSVNWTPID